jgi:hypothetical protein
MTKMAELQHQKEKIAMPQKKESCKDLLRRVLNVFDFLSKAFLLNSYRSKKISLGFISEFLVDKMPIIFVGFTFNLA